MEDEEARRTPAERLAALRQSGPYVASDGYMSVAVPSHKDVAWAVEEIDRLTADRNRYREAEYWLWSKGQRVCNGVSGAVEELGATLLKYSGPEWAEWNPWMEEE